MKLLKATIYALYLIVYAYAVWMTSLKPEETYWGFICVGIFAFLFISLISTIIKKDNKTQENNQENL
jgi:4-hydroxybenzoate polyprenyltransferase